MLKKQGSGCFLQLLLVCVICLLIVYLLGGRHQSLEPWHTEELSAEYRADVRDKIKTFNDYKHLEDRLFEQLSAQVYSRTPTGKGYELVRYSAGSAADPRYLQPDWNRSFELSAEKPVGGVLLLHGMSDSPYSLRALGEAFNQRSYWVIGLRLPGHGTAPSGLTTSSWEDMAAAAELAVAHLSSQVGEKPIHIVGYSTGAPLALHYTLNALEEKAAPLPRSLILVSPAIGIHPLAWLAKIKNWLSIVPGLGHFAWLSIEPEFDPYKYNSFAANAGAQVHRLTRSVAQRISDWSKQGRLDSFPPILVFKSTVDATVSTAAVVDRLLKPLADHGHELVLFDINRFAAKSSLLVSDPGPVTARLMEDSTLPFGVTLIANKNPGTLEIIAQHKAPESNGISEMKPLGLVWPPGVLSLSHVALPFPPDDPLYGQRPPGDDSVLFLGQMALQGERGLLKISSDWLLRLRYNPFYEFLEKRALDWLNDHNN